MRHVGLGAAHVERLVALEMRGRVVLVGVVRVAVGVEHALGAVLLRVAGATLVGYGAQLDVLLLVALWRVVEHHFALQLFVNVLVWRLVVVRRLASVAVGSAHFGHAAVQHHEDAYVEENGDNEGDEETAEGRVEDVALCLEENALDVVDACRFVYVVRCHVIPAKQRGNTDRSRENPNYRDVDGSLLRRPFLAVPYGVESRRETIQSNNTQVPYGSSTIQHIQTQPHIADNFSEYPIAQAFIYPRQGNNCRGQEKVTEGQIADEIITDCPQVPVLEEGEHD